MIDVLGIKLNDTVDLLLRLLEYISERQDINIIPVIKKGIDNSLL